MKFRARIWGGKHGVVACVLGGAASLFASSANVACGDGKPVDVPHAAPLAIASSAAPPAVNASRPEKLGAWVHIDDAMMWLTAWRGIMNEIEAKHAAENQAKTDEDKKIDDEMNALMATLRPGSSVDLAFVRTGPTSKDVEAAFWVAIKDDATFRSLLVPKYDIKRTETGFYAHRKKEAKKAGLAGGAAEDNDNDSDDDESDAPAATPAPPGAPPAKAEKQHHKKKKKDENENDLACWTKGDHAVCGIAGKINPQLFAWLETRPVMDGAQPGNIVAEAYVTAAREELAALASPSKSPAAQALAENADRLRMVTTLGPKGFGMSLALSLKGNPKTDPWFQADPRRAAPARVLAMWPKNSTLAVALPPLTPLAKLVQTDLKAIGDPKVAAALPAVMRFADRALGWGSVVERDELARLVKAVDAAGDNGTKLFSLKREMRRVIGGYSLVGISEVGTDGSKLTVKDVIDTFTQGETNVRKPRAVTGKGLPAGAMFLEKLDTLDLSAPPGPKAIPKKSATPAGEAKGDLFVNDGKGVIWIFSSNEEAFIEAAAKRFLTSPAADASGTLPPFDAQTATVMSWSSAFGSYWSSEIELGGGLGGLGDLDFASAGQPKKKPSTVLTAEQIKSLHKTADGLKTTLAEPTLRIPIVVTTDSATHTLAVSTQAPLATWKTAGTNAAGPLGMLALPLLIGISSLSK